MPDPTTPSGGLEGFAVLVTGGGSGIGKACAARLAADGAAVTICGRTASKLEEAAHQIEKGAGHGGSVQFATADVTDEEDVKRLIAKALEPTGQLNGCLANAGGAGGMGPYQVQDKDEFVRVLHLNVLGTLLCVKHAVPPMVAAGGGSFVGMSSIAGHVPHLFFGAYCVAKAGIEEMMRNAANEFGARKVRFNAIRPGFIATELMQGIPRDGATYASYLANTPLNDVGQPEDVAQLARFLIGNESRWITGTCINVDGGHALRGGPDFGPFLEPSLGKDVMEGELPK
ncbi:MAG: SDR family oxidoreductase [Deltaproteobacteria bacterium]|nr:SDR family oxidoreductase [Deltaproteobacteria bacterium]MBW2393960.1 SDR family oxidoreductase [Deltaproteobacteria bacterium]